MLLLAVIFLQLLLCKYIVIYIITRFASREYDDTGCWMLAFSFFQVWTIPLKFRMSMLLNAESVDIAQVKSFSETDHLSIPASESYRLVQSSRASHTTPSGQSYLLAFLNVGILVLIGFVLIHPI